MLARILPLLSLTAAAAFSSFCDDDAKGGWRLVWSDEFNQATLNESTWTVALGGPNAEGRMANVTTEDTYLSNGNLVLRSRQHNSGPGLVNGTSWTTGGVLSREKASFQYGRSSHLESP